jgi:hypothetical protein
LETVAAVRMAAGITGAADLGRSANPGLSAEVSMTNREFERLDRVQRLATLKFVADRDGIDSPLYTALAAQHQWLLGRDSGGGPRRPIR